MTQNYYQKEIETMSREDMKVLQSEKLVFCLERADLYRKLSSTINIHIQYVNMIS